MKGWGGWGRLTNQWNIECGRGGGWGVLNVKLIVMGGCEHCVSWAHPFSAHVCSTTLCVKC